MNTIPYEVRKGVYADALDAYGTGAQLIVAIEELSELQKELCKVLRGDVRLSALQEEVADVTIMLEQIRQAFNINELVCQTMDFKILRLKRRISDTKANRDIGHGVRDAEEICQNR